MWRAVHNAEKPLDPNRRSANMVKHVFGALAQLGERMAGSHEVRGSIPLCSTKFSQASGIVAGLFPFKTDFKPTFTDLA